MYTKKYCIYDYILYVHINVLLKFGKCQWSTVPTINVHIKCMLFDCVIDEIVKCKIISSNFCLFHHYFLQNYGVCI